jgi:uncharacterized protein with beta-barrel porin domain
LSHKFEIADGTDTKTPDLLTPEIDGGWLHEILTPRSNVTVAFDGIAGSSFSSTSVTPARNAAALGGASAFTPGSLAAMSVHAHYEAALSSVETDHSVTAGLRYGW